MLGLEVPRLLTILAYLIISFCILNFCDEVLGGRSRSRSRSNGIRKSRNRSRYGHKSLSRYPYNRLRQSSGDEDEDVDVVEMDTQVSNNTLTLDKKRYYMECDLLGYGNIVRLHNFVAANFTVKELPQGDQRVEKKPWMSCRFLRWLDQDVLYTPPRQTNLTFDHFLNISLSGTRGQSSFTRISLRFEGIFVNGELASYWNSTNDGVQFSTNPGLKFLKAHNGKKCQSICTKRSDLERAVPQCLDGVFEFESEYTQNCTPVADFDIRDHAYNRILSSQGVPCISACEWDWNGNSNMFKCILRRYGTDRPAGFAPCAPRFNHTVRGEPCLSDCKFRGNNRDMNCRYYAENEPEQWRNNTWTMCGGA